LNNKLNYFKGHAKIPSSFISISISSKEIDLVYRCISFKRQSIIESEIEYLNLNKDYLYVINSIEEDISCMTWCLHVYGSPKSFNLILHLYEYYYLKKMLISYSNTIFDNDLQLYRYQKIINKFQVISKSDSVLLDSFLSLSLNERINLILNIWDSLLI
ncbi:MAG: hypothetical protein MJA82_15640, partial [Clostridia bacterium]|nr:hypothetical protein [Clostridia bacterium]